MAGRNALTRRQVLAGSLAGSVGLSLAARRVAGAERASQPNIVFLLADDLGYADLSCYGRNFSTPRIDSLARQGALLTQAYSSSAVCSPTRVALITGRYPARLRVGMDEPLGTEREGLIGLPASGPVPFYYVALLVFAACALMMALLVRSPFGLTLQGMREHEPRMRSLGFNTWLHGYVSYVCAGAFASIAGIMWAYYNGFVSPTYLDLTASSELFLMVTLGGPATLVGPVIGAGAIVILKNVISAYTARWLLILGIVYIVTILWAPQGLWNLGRERRS